MTDADEARPDRFWRSQAPATDFRREPAIRPPADVLRLLRVLEDPQRIRDRPTQGQETWQVPTCWVAGGALRDAFAGDERSDIDVFFTDLASATNARRRLLDCPSIGAQLAGAVFTVDTNVGRVELVVGTFFKSSVDVLRTFDFTACCAAADALGRVTVHRDFELDAEAHRLRVNALPTPVCSFWRYHRLKARGWRMPPEEYRGLLRAAVELSGSESWVRDYGGGGDAPPKDMPAWAVAAWAALESTADRPKLTAVMRRAVEDPAWATELESVAPLSRDGGERDWLKLKRLAAVREFICATVGER